MTEGPALASGCGAACRSAVRQWAPRYSAPQAPRSRMSPAIALGAAVLALVSTVVAVVALVMATSSRSPDSSNTSASAVSTYSAAELSAAHQKLCGADKLAACPGQQCMWQLNLRRLRKSAASVQSRGSKCGT